MSVFVARLRAMLRLGEAQTSLATVTRSRQIIDLDEARAERLGDVEGQTERAQAFAVELERAAKVARPA